MSTEKDSEVLKLALPDLFSREHLIGILKARIPRLQNLEAAPKERLVQIFRQMILPLPQRLYRTNRRGKILTSRRAKAGLEAKPRREGEKPSFQTIEKSSTKRPSDERLKPPPDSSRPAKIRLCSDRYDDSDLSTIVINERRKSKEKREVESDRHMRSNYETTSSRKIVLKRSSSSATEKRSSPPRSSESSSTKRQKTAIKWP